jgi:hypothetical protein
VVLMQLLVLVLVPVLMFVVLVLVVLTRLVACARIPVAACCCSCLEDKATLINSLRTIVHADYPLTLTFPLSHSLRLWMGVALETQLGSTK